MSKVSTASVTPTKTRSFPIHHGVSSPVLMTPPPGWNKPVRNSSQEELSKALCRSDPIHHASKRRRIVSFHPSVVTVTYNLVSHNPPPGYQTSSQQPQQQQSSINHRPTVNNGMWRSLADDIWCNILQFCHCEDKMFNFPLVCASSNRAVHQSHSWQSLTNSRLWEQITINKWIEFARTRFRLLTVADLSHLEIDDRKLLYLARNAPRLTTIKLSHCNQISELGMSSLARNCRELRCVDMSWMESVSTHSIGSLIRSQQWLEALLIRGCRRMRNIGNVLTMSDFSQRYDSHQSLRVLDLSYCHVLDSDLIAIAKCFTRLEDIRLLKCESPQLTTNGIVNFILTAKKHIKRLELSFTCCNDTSVEAILGACDELEYLGVCGCNISPQLLNNHKLKHPKFQYS